MTTGLHLGPGEIRAGVGWHDVLDHNETRVGKIGVGHHEVTFEGKPQLRFNSVVIVGDDNAKAAEFRDLPTRKAATNIALDYIQRNLDRLQFGPPIDITRPPDTG